MGQALPDDRTNRSARLALCSQSLHAMLHKSGLKKAVCALIPAPSGPSSTINSPRFALASPAMQTPLFLWDYITK